MLALAGREADGAILNWLGADDVKKAVAEIGGEGHKESCPDLRRPHPTPTWPGPSGVA